MIAPGNNIGFGCPDCSSPDVRAAWEKEHNANAAEMETRLQAHKQRRAQSRHGSDEEG
jgi:hypothetical protein